MAGVGPETPPLARANEGRERTKERLEREFMNAKTPFDQWKVFQEALNWATTASELYDTAQWQITEGRAQ